ncbi:MAG: HNH endonuclease [Bacteroidales bacterium]
MLKLVNLYADSFDSDDPYAPPKPRLDFLYRREDNYYFVATLLNFAEYFRYSINELLQVFKDSFDIDIISDPVHARDYFWMDDIVAFQTIPLFHPWDLFLIKNGFTGKFSNSLDVGNYLPYGICDDWVHLRGGCVTRGNYVEKICTYYDGIKPKNKKDFYHGYLRTGLWQEKRKQKLEEAEHRCQLCNSSDGLQVHHRTYDNVFNERKSDLIVLCRDCHARFHDKV